MVIEHTRGKSSRPSAFYRKTKIKRLRSSDARPIFIIGEPGRARGSTMSHHAEVFTCAGLQELSTVRKRGGGPEPPPRDFIRTLFHAPNSYLSPTHSMLG